VYLRPQPCSPSPQQSLSSSPPGQKAQRWVRDNVWRHESALEAITLGGLQGNGIAVVAGKQQQCGCEH
jgi:hypothetical protein